MYELKLSELTKMIVKELEKDGLSTSLKNPQSDSEFPCAVVGTPLKSVLLTENGIPVRTALSIPIEYWANKKYEAMDISDDGDKKLSKLNFIRVNTTIDMYDDITKKYRYGGNYEVIYNGITNALERRR